MADFRNVSGQVVEEAGVLDDKGNNIQDGVKSIDQINKQFGGSVVPPVKDDELHEDDEPSKPTKIELATDKYDPDQEIKIGEDVYKADDILATAAEEAKKDPATLSEQEKATLVAGFVKKATTNTGTGAPATAEDKEITIGGETKKSSEWFAQMETEDEADYSDLPEKTRQNLLNRFVTEKNRSEWEKAGQQRDQVTAERRAQLAREAKDISQKKRSLEHDKKRIEERIKKARELATKQFDEQELYDADGKLLPKKNFEYNQILTAQQQLPELESELQQISDETAQADADHLLAQINSLQANHPELQTKESFVEVVRKVEKERQFDHPDYPTLRMVRRVIDEADRERVDAETAYKNLVLDGVIKPVRATQPPNQPMNRQSQSPAKKLADSLVRKQNITAASLPQGGIPPRPKPKGKVTMGQQISAALGGTGNKALETAGY